MSHIQADRVKETTTTTGTGDLTLGGAVSKFQTFGSRMANGDTTYYAIEHQAADEWEVGFGTWTTGGILQRTLVLQSSNADAAVNLTSGTKHVAIVLPSIAAGFGSLVVTPAANQDDYNPTGLKLASRLQVDPSASMKLTGLAGGHETRRLVIANTSTDFLVWLEHESAASTAANRFFLPMELPVFLFPGDRAEFVYSGSRWRYTGGAQMAAMGLDTFEDFMTSPQPANNGAAGRYGVHLSGSASGVDTSSNNITTANRPLGQVAMSKGTTAAGRAAVGMGTVLGVGTVLPAFGAAMVVGRVRPLNQPDATDTFAFYVGMGDMASGSIGRAVAWELRWNGSAAEWAQVTRDGTTLSRSTTGSPTPALTFLTLGVFINPAWTRADFLYATDGKTFQVANAVTANLPQGQNPSAPGMAIVGSVGTANRSVIVDYLGHRVQYART